jgi:hypothetical protein
VRAGGLFTEASPSYRFPQKIVHILFASHLI